MSSLIKLENVYKTYQTGDNRIDVLRDIDLIIERGEMAAVIGASGSGKSTLMNIIGFLDRCTTGRYVFDGKDVSDLSDDELALIRNHKVGFVFQSFFLLPRSSALQNVMLPLFYRGLESEAAREAALDIMNKVGVAHLAHHHPNQLSGGQQQRVAIARALVGNPDIILADEPTGALDSQTSDDVMKLFEALNQEEGRTILIITHDNAVSERCQRVLVMKDGRISPSLASLSSKLYYNTA